MKRAVTVVALLVLAVGSFLVIPEQASAGSSTDAALALGAFAVFNQIVSGTGVFSAPVVVQQPPAVVYTPPPPVVYAPAPAVVYVPAPPPAVYYVPAPQPVYYIPAPSPVVTYTYPYPYAYYRARW